jgi:hypothetical protein
VDGQGRLPDTRHPVNRRDRYRPGGRAQGRGHGLREVIQLPQQRLAPGEPVQVGRQLGRDGHGHGRERRGRGRGGGARVAAQDRLVHVLQRPPGIGAQRLGQPLADGGVATDGLRVPARRVQRLHEEALERLRQRVLGDQAGQGVDHRRGLSE